MLMTSCYEGELYDEGPDWVTDKIAEEAAKKAAEGSGETPKDEIEGMMEDVYTTGATDFSSGWWANFTKYYQIPEKAKWIAQFNLNINPDASNTYKNFALILTNDVDRGGEGYKEYGAIRYDHQPSGNSEWGDYIDRSLVTSDLTFETDTDNGVDQLGGKVTLTIDRSEGGLVVTMDNGKVKKAYNQTATPENFNADASNTIIRAFLCVEGSYIDFLGTTIEPIGGCTSANDKQPVSMTLYNVPSAVPIADNLDINEIMQNITATVTYEEGVTKNITAEDLVLMAIPDLTTSGDKQLVAAYSKSFKGEPTKPVMANANFKIVNFNQIIVEDIPALYFNPDSYTENDQMEISKTMIKAKGVASNGDETPFTAELLAALSFEKIPAKAGQYTAKGSWNGLETTVNITAKPIEKETLAWEGKTSGMQDKSGGWYNADLMSDSYKIEDGKAAVFNFKNYGGPDDWANFVVALTEAGKGSGTGGIFSNEWGCVVPSNLNKWGTGVTDELQITSNLPAYSQQLWDGADAQVTVINYGGKTADIICNFTLTDGNNYQVTYTNFVIGGDLYVTIAADAAYVTFK